MKEKHTPGPWKARRPYPDDGYVVCQVEKKPSIGAIVIARDIEQGYDSGEADAKLIAAAPDLLEAIQLLLINGDFYEEYKMRHTGIPAPIRKRILAAIKKATE